MNVKIFSCKFTNMTIFLFFFLEASRLCKFVTVIKVFRYLFIFKDTNRGAQPETHKISFDLLLFVQPQFEINPKTAVSPIQRETFEHLQRHTWQIRRLKMLLLGRTEEWKVGKKNQLCASKKPAIVFASCFFVARVTQKPPINGASIKFAETMERVVGISHVPFI